MAGRRLLVAEDNGVIQQIAATLLSAAGADVEVVDDGARAVQRARDAVFDAILMDLEMPVMDGAEAARRISGRPGAAPIVAMTGHAADAQMLTDAGDAFADHVAKPFDPAALIETVARQCGACAAAPAATAAARPAAAPDAKRIALSRLTRLDAAALVGVLGDPEFVARLLIQFREHEGAAGDLIVAAVRDRRLDDAARLAHKLKGVAGNLRADAVHAAADLMEARLIGGRGDHDDADLAALADIAASLREAVAHVMADIDAARHAAVADAAKDIGDAALDDALGELRELLGGYDLAADDAWEVVEPALRRRAPAVADVVHAAVAELDYAAAADALDALRTEDAA